MEPILRKAAEHVARAEALFIGAGAGMGVDSGLPDFRGNEGFWRAYPPFAKANLSFVDLANPTWFERDPALAWGFYGHRLQLYRDTVPHPGFKILRDWATQMEHGAFVFTSNVDGQFQRAGFPTERVIECHGSIHHFQCSRPCCRTLWSAEAIEVVVDLSTLRAQGSLPACSKCGGVARPNILMFGDAHWLSERADEQNDFMHDWLASVLGKQVAVVELGAGSGVPTVRWTCERMARQLDVPLIRINPRESHGPAGTISIASGALEALSGIDRFVMRSS